MTPGRRLGIERALLVALLLCVAPAVHAGTVYVANNGVDSTLINRLQFEIARCHNARR
jgi:hypothetical protein